MTLLMVLTLMLAACGGGTTPGQSSNGTKNSVLTVVPSPIGDFAKAFSPYSASPRYGTQGLVYETLMFFNREDGTSKPWLATSTQVSADAKTITFNLRQGVKWSDGKPFTSDDVAFTLNMLKQYPAADGSALWKTIKSVENPDANTVVVNLLSPSSPILWYLGGQTWIVPKHIFETAGDPTKFVNDNPIGTGPYTLKSMTPQLIDWVKNPNFWQPGKPEINEIRYPSFKSNTGAELVLSRGEVDWTGLFTPDINKTFVSRNPKTNHYWFPSANVVMLYLNLTKAPFNNLAVRQAISLVLDRDQMFKVAESGYEPVAHPTALVLPANQSFMSTDLASNAFAIDTAKAQSLLEGAGYTKGSDGIYADKSGKKLEFGINVVTGWTDWVTNCQIMAKNLTDLGMKVTVNSVSFDAYFAGLQSGKYDASISWTNTGPTPYYLYYSLLGSANTAPIGQNAPSNWERWQDKQTDDLLAQFAGSTDKDTQQKALNGLQKIMVDQLPSIPLVYGATWYEYSTARFTGWPTEKDPYAMPAPYSFPDAEVVILNLKSV